MTLWQRNDSGFVRVDESVHSMAPVNSRGMATFDYDHDGDPDVVIATYGGPVVLYENTVDRGNAIEFEVVDGGGATAHGAKVTVEFGDENITVQQTDENGFFSSDSRAVHVGLGQAKSATLTVTWPGGTERTFEIEANRRYRIAPSGVTVVANLTVGDG